MKKNLTLLLLLTFFVLASRNAQAFIIIDTGPGNLGAPGYVADKEYWKATEISLSKATRIMDIYHWQYIYGIGAPNRPMDLALYGDGGDIPNTLDELYRTSYSVAETSVTDWYGVSNLNWTVGPGEYWIALEPFINVDPDDDLYRFSVLPFGSPVPLINNASAYQGNYENWSAMHSKPFEWGLRVNGSSAGPTPPQSPVSPNSPTAPTSPSSPFAPQSPTSPTLPFAPRSPFAPTPPTPPGFYSAQFQGGGLPTITNPEPSTVLLLGGGLFGAAAMLRRKKRA